MPVIADKFIPLSLVDISERFYELGTAYASLNSLIGSLDTISTDTKSNLVAAINELVNHQGSLSSLSTSAKTTLVAAINEVLANEGALSSLTTSAKTTLVAAINELFGFLQVLKEGSGAGLHNSLYRGKNIGTSLSNAQSSAIRAGTFNDLWIGDYWVIGGVNYRITDFDYFLNCYNLATHHAVVVPDTVLYNARMNATNTTAGGYTGSEMRTTNLAQANTTFNNAFGSGHILTHKEALINSISEGRPAGMNFFNCTVEIMDERMVYGSTQFDSGHTDGSVGDPIFNGNFQMQSFAYKHLNLFRMRPDIICNKQHFWMRNIVSETSFAYLNGTGNCSSSLASDSRLGVRPYALIY